MFLIQAKAPLGKSQLRRSGEMGGRGRHGLGGRAWVMEAHEENALEEDSDTARFEWAEGKGNLGLATAGDAAAVGEEAHKDEGNVHDEDKEDQDDIGEG